MRYSQGTAWGSFFTSTLVLPHVAWSIPILGQDPAQSIATTLLPARARCRGLDVAPGQVRAAPAAGHWAEQHRHCPQCTLCSAPQCDDCSDWLSCRGFFNIQSTWDYVSSLLDLKQDLSGSAVAGLQSHLSADFCGNWLLLGSPKSDPTWVQNLEACLPAYAYTYLADLKTPQISISVVQSIIMFFSLIGRMRITSKFDRAVFQSQVVWTEYSTFVIESVYVIQYSPSPPLAKHPCSILIDVLPLLDVIVWCAVPKNG